MKAPPFAYMAPDSVEGVVAGLVEGGEDAKIIAGGQSLLPVLALRLGRPSVLVDVGAVPGLAGVEVVGSELVLGARVTQATLGRHPDVAVHAPVVAEVVPLIAHAAIRSRGTLGGSLAHNDPAAELPALALLSGATIVARGPGGRRTVPAAEFFVSYLTTALAPDEVLEEVRLPVREAGSGAAFAEVSRRHGDFALVGAGAQVDLDDSGALASARLVFIGVGSTAVLDLDVGVELAGQRPTDSALDSAARAAAARLDPLDDLHASAHYRRRVAASLGRRVLERAAVRARESITGGPT